jgi:N-acetylglutamate synthase-like GNAT family acetyltransferase
MYIQIASDLQKKEIYKYTYLEWGDKLTLEEYFKREEFLGSTSFSKKHLNTWVLVDEQNNILSSLETYEMKNSVFGIASVCTPKQNRGKGFASFLLKEVIQKILNSKFKAKFLLFSEVEPKIYKNLGFKEIFTQEYFIKFTQPLFDKENFSKLKIHYLNLSEIEKVLNDIQVTISPSFEQFLWHFKRSEFYALCFKINTKLEYGIKLDDGSFLIWFYDFKKNQLKSLCFAPKSIESQKVLIECAQNECKKFGLEEFIIYEKDYNTKWLKNLLTIRENQDGVPMVLNFKEPISFLSRIHWI